MLYKYCTQVQILHTVLPPKQTAYCSGEFCPLLVWPYPEAVFTAGFLLENLNSGVDVAEPFHMHPIHPPPHLPHKHNPSIHGHQKALTANRFVVVLFRFLPRPRRYPKFFPASPVDTWDVKIHSKNQVQNSSRVFRGFYRPTVQI